LWRGLARCWAATAALGAGLTLLHRVTGWWAGWVFPSFVAATVGWALVIWRRWRANEPDYREVARQIERENPKLHALLLTAVEQQPDPATGALNYLQQRVVLARFEGNLPAEASLVLKPLNEPERRLPLAKNLDDPVFGASVPEVKSDLAYRVEFAGRQTRDFNVTVFDYPKMERADAKVTFPKYTGL